AENLPPVSADPVQLEQVLLNMVRNGLDSLQSSDSESRRLVVSTLVDSARSIRVTVQDTGSGLDQESMSHVFDRFYTTKKGGLGMGLCISRSIIESHGGRMWVESQPGSGASFHFTVPAN
ncbi:MAG: sensor histidine kinase, partial [Gammaproteobacteria bacterium]